MVNKLVKRSIKMLIRNHLRIVGKRDLEQLEKALREVQHRIKNKEKESDTLLMLNLMEHSVLHMINDKTE